MSVQHGWIIAEVFRILPDLESVGPRGAEVDQVATPADIACGIESYSCRVIPTTQEMLCLSPLGIHTSETPLSRVFMPDRNGLCHRCELRNYCPGLFS